MLASGHSRETFNNTDPSSDKQSLEQRIEWALLKEVYARQAFTMGLQAATCAAFYPFGMRSTLVHVEEWLIGLLGYAVLGFLIQWQFRKKQNRLQHLRGWQTLFIGQCALNGIIWTSTPCLNLLEASSPTTLSLCLTSVLGASAVSLGVLSPQRYGMAAFAACALVPPSMVLFISGTTDHLIIAVVVMLAAISFIAVGYDMHIKLRRQLQAQFALERALLEASEARQQAESASKAKGQFLATMSHELRTPMNGVLGMLQLVRETDVSPQQRLYLDKMNGAAQSLLTLLNDVLDFSKIEADSLKARKQPFRIDAVLHNLSDILSGNVRRDLVEILFDVDANVPGTLIGDEQLLQQVMVNLAGNALKFTHEGSVLVSLHVVQRDAYSVRLRFAVRDTGIGIAPEHLSVIFDAFAQAESSTTRRFGGTGLGLSISKNLVQLMGGTLQVESTLGVGSTFWFELDLEIAEANLHSGTKQLEEAASPAMTQTHTTPSKHFPRLQGVQVLLAEDNLLNQQIACELLELEGATVRAVANGQEALDALTALAADTRPLPDVVLMDMHMPVLDGLDATRRIRQIAHLRKLPILAMTANALVQDRQACLDAGMNGHIGKPFTIDALVSAIQAKLRAPS